MVEDLTVTPGRVATIEMRRAPNNNLDVDLLQRILDALTTLATDGECRAVVLCSEGKHFCAGVDFNRPDSAEIDASGKHLYDVALRLFAQPLPLVAAVQGAAVGGGLGLALAADFRIATPEARFSANFARLGFHHGFGLTVTLPALVGQQNARRLLFTAERVGGERALALGLCDQVVPAADLRAAAGRFASEIAESAPLAVRSIRATLNDGRIEALSNALDRERREQARLTRTADWKEGLKASAERRDPHFVGR